MSEARRRPRPGDDPERGFVKLHVALLGRQDMTLAQKVLLSLLIDKQQICKYSYMSWRGMAETLGYGRRALAEGRTPNPECGAVNVKRLFKKLRQKFPGLLLIRPGKSNGPHGDTPNEVVVNLAALDPMANPDPAGRAAQEAAAAEYAARWGEPRLVSDDETSQAEGLSLVDPPPGSATGSATGSASAPPGGALALPVGGAFARPYQTEGDQTNHQTAAGPPPLAPGGGGGPPLPTFDPARDVPWSWWALAPHERAGNPATAIAGHFERCERAGRPLYAVARKDGVKRRILRMRPDRDCLLVTLPHDDRPGETVTHRLDSDRLTAAKFCTPKAGA